MPSYTPTDIAAAVSALLGALLDLAVMFGVIKLTPDQRNVVLAALTPLVGILVSWFFGSRLAKHLAELRAARH